MLIPDTVVIEAEAALLDAGESRASVVADGSASAGKAIAVVAPKGTGKVALTYVVDLPSPGAYTVAISARSADGQVSTADLDLTMDGRPVASVSGARGLGLTWSWDTHYDRSGLLATVTVAAAGLHRLTLSVSNGDAAFDRLVIGKPAGLRLGEPVARRIADFRNALGVNTHLLWSDTPYGDDTGTRAALNYLGLPNIRDVVTPQPAMVERMRALGESGYQFNVLIGRDVGTLKEQFARIEVLSPYVTAVEGANESDSSSYVPLTDGTLKGTKSLQTDIARMARDVANRPLVVQASFTKAQTWTSYGDQSAVADAGNSHNYYNRGSPPGATVRDRIVEAQAITPGRPPVATEAGYHTAYKMKTPWQQGLTYDVHAKYQIRTLLELFAQGYKAIYLYELFDFADDPSRTNPEKNFGLFFNTGTPKIAATAIHNLMAILSDQDATAGSFTPGAPDYAIVGMPGTAGELLMQSSDGTFYLVLWNDANGWDSLRRRAVVVPDARVEVRLAQPFEATLFRPNASAHPVSHHSRTDHLTLDLPDEPIVIRLSP